jgi:hypothetical protein
MHTGVNILPDSSWGPFQLATGAICVLYHFFKIAEAGESSTFSVTSPASVTWAVVLQEYTADSEATNDFALVDSNKAAGASSYTLSVASGGKATGDTDFGIAAFASQGGTARTFTSWSDGFVEVADLQPAGTVVAYLGVAAQVYNPTPDYPLFTVGLSGVTATKPSMLIQALNTIPNPDKTRSQLQQAAGRW